MCCPLLSFPINTLTGVSFSSMKPHIHTIAGIVKMRQKFGEIFANMGLLPSCSHTNFRTVVKYTTVCVCVWCSCTSPSFLFDFTSQSFGRGCYRVISVLLSTNSKNLLLQLLYYCLWRAWLCLPGY